MNALWEWGTWVSDTPKQVDETDRLGTMSPNYDLIIPQDRQIFDVAPRNLKLLDIV